MTGYGINLKNTFAFGVIRTSVVRVWLGPAIRSYVDYYTEGDGAIMFGIGGGPEVGVNIHLGDTVSLSVSGGYQYSYVGLYPFSDMADYADEFSHTFSVKVSPVFLTGEDKGSW